MSSRILYDQICKIKFIRYKTWISKKLIPMIIFVKKSRLLDLAIKSFEKILEILKKDFIYLRLE